LFSSLSFSSFSRSLFQKLTPVDTAQQTAMSQLDQSFSPSSNGTPLINMRFFLPVLQLFPESL
jgi:hypothetical protein